MDENGTVCNRTEQPKFDAQNPYDLRKQSVSLLSASGGSNPG